jgi:hypothetical protein
MIKGHNVIRVLDKCEGSSVPEEVEWWDAQTPHKRSDGMDAGV